MSEHQLFCFAEEYGSIYRDSMQQKSYRIFNIEVSKEEYMTMMPPSIKLWFNKNEPNATRYSTAFKNAWSLLNQEQKKKFTSLPHFNKDIFLKITGVDVDLEPSNQMTIKEIEKRLEINNLKIID
jgi:hypothetical protein